MAKSVLVQITVVVTFLDLCGSSDVSDIDFWRVQKKDWFFDGPGSFEGDESSDIGQMSDFVDNQTTFHHGRVEPEVQKWIPAVPDRVKSLHLVLSCHQDIFDSCKLENAAADTRPTPFVKLDGGISLSLSPVNARHAVVSAHRSLLVCFPPPSLAVALPTPEFMQRIVWLLLMNAHGDMPIISSPLTYWVYGSAETLEPVIEITEVLKIVSRGEEVYVQFGEMWMRLLRQRTDTSDSILGFVQHPFTRQLIYSAFVMEHVQATNPKVKLTFLTTNEQTWATEVFEKLTKWLGAASAISSLCLKTF